MKGTDKFLIGIVAGVVLLVVLAFVIAFLRPAPAYQSDTTPEGVAHNYLLALQQKDYARAYSYLSPTLIGYPATVEAFIRDVQNNDYAFRRYDASTTSAVESAQVTGDRAEVEVRETHFYNNGLFGSDEYTETFEMQLKRENGAWKITGYDRYWANCWTDTTAGCQ